MKFCPNDIIRLMTDNSPETISSGLNFDKEKPFADANLINRLNAWVSERSGLLLLSEKRARKQIADAAILDINSDNNEGELHKTVLTSTKEMRVKIDQLIPADNGEFTTSRDPLSDSLTGEEYFVRFKKENGIYTAEEVKPDGDTMNIISQSRVYPDGTTELTLNYTGLRYEDKTKGIDRNPKIAVDRNFPRASSKHFDTLVRYSIK